MPHVVAVGRRPPGAPPDRVATPYRLGEHAWQHLQIRRISTMASRQAAATAGHLAESNNTHSGSRLMTNTNALSDDSASQSAYGTGAAVLHWLIGVLLLGQIGFGWFLETIPRGVPARGFYVNLHKSTGLTLALLILIRIVWRLTHPAPPMPAVMPVWERVAARWSHWVLYACMLVMPLSGYIASNF